VKDLLGEERTRRVLGVLESVTKDVETDGTDGIVVLRLHGPNVDVSWAGADELKVLGALERAKFVFNQAGAGTPEIHGL